VTIMNQPRSPTKKGASSKTKRLSPGRAKASSRGASATPGGGKTRQEWSRAPIAGGTPSRDQVREVTGPRLNVPRQSQRPVERSNQRRSRRS
jgi:hypothetical protein